MSPRSRPSGHHDIASRGEDRTATKTLSTVVAIATLGAGLVHLAVGAGAPPLLLAVFVAAGAAETGWAIATLVADRVPAPRAFLLIALLPVAAWAVAVAAGAASDVPAGPLGAASVLSFVSAAVVAASIRRSPTRSATDDGGTTTRAASAAPADETTEHPWRFLATLAVSATIVAGIVTPALSGTWAGRYAEPHGTHDVTVLEVDGHDGH